MREPSARAGLGRQAVPGESPTGRALGDDPDFELLRAEATKDPVKGIPTEWPRVVELGSRILAEKSKDVPTCSYWTLGLLHTEGPAGLLDGLRALEGLLSEYWETAFPPVPARLRARANAIDWLAERAAAELGRRPISAAERDAVLASLQAAGDLQKILDERFLESPVSLVRVTETLREILARLPEPEPPRDPSAAAGSRSSAAPADAALTSDADAELWLLRCADFHLDRDPASPLGHRILRVACWGSVIGAPPSDRGRLLVSGPPSELASRLQGLAAAAQWAELLGLSSASFREHPLWLDLQRHADRALEALGPEHAAAGEALRGELRLLLERAPGLAELAFQDGTSLADAETRRWLEERVRGAGAGAATGSGAGAAVDAEREAARAEARALARKGRLAEALAGLEPLLRGEASARSRFLARLELASLCAEVGEDRLAAPLLEALDAELGRRALEDWEPRLAAQVLEALYRSRRRLAERAGGGDDSAAKAQQVFERICRIDPVAAAALE